MEFTEEQANRYARHFVLSELGMKGQKKLLDSRVLVIGCGAIGGAALMYLAAAGVGTIGISDFDTVDISNLQRQIIHRTDRIGTDKCQSAKQTLEEINPGIKVITHNAKVTVGNILCIVADYDFILDCTDRFATKFLINDACVLSKKPYSHAGVIRFGGQIMTYVPDKGPCLRCILEDVPADEDALSCAKVGVLGSVTGIIGSIQATEAIKYLLDIGELLTGRVLGIDALTMRFHATNIPASPDCRICGDRAKNLSLKDNFSEYTI